MLCRLKKWTLRHAVVLAALGLAEATSPAQQPCRPYPGYLNYAPPSPYPNCPPAPGFAPAVPGTGVPMPPAGTDTGAGAGAGTAGAGDMGAAEAAAPTFAALAAGAGGGSSTALATPGGYLDNAIPKTMFRLRYDAGFDLNRPDRAEYFYAAWLELAFHAHGIQQGGVFFDRHARGPEQLPAHLNYQEVSGYLEYALNKRLSFFAELPYRFVAFRNLQEDPDTEGFPEPASENPNNQEASNHPFGLSDVQAGFKYAFLADPDQYLTFQFRTYVPTGNSYKGLGTGHVALEPSLLYYKSVDRWQFQGQFTDWIPAGGSSEAGNILIYGAGLGYDIYRCGNLRVTPITEFVGWTVLNGYEAVFTTINTNLPPGVIPTTHGVRDAGGETIVNAKVGVRTYFGNGSDVYVGYGHSLTGDRWYKDIFRLEYRFSF